MYFVLKIINGALQAPGWAINLVIITNWFPRTGRGLLIGIFATNTSLGDIIGTQVYKHFSADAETSWSVSFFILGGLVIFMGLLNLVVLVQYPRDVKINIEEKGVLIGEAKEISTPVMHDRLIHDHQQLANSEVEMPIKIPYM
mmetsp:Transcript_26887/g.40981  ORF Transcript_26887/g.40981 Transcript_26887/m.40981 type:complete len:143 (-) Transcript_26887:747-1175(-)